MSGESAMEIDYQTCKRLGASYCALPKDTRQVCSREMKPVVDFEIRNETNLLRNFINKAISSQKDIELADGKENEFPEDKENVLSKIGSDFRLPVSKRLGEMLLSADINLPDEDKDDTISEVDRHCNLSEAESKWLRKVQRVSLCECVQILIFP